MSKFIICILLLQYAGKIIVGNIYREIILYNINNDDDTKSVGIYVISTMTPLLSH